MKRLFAISAMFLAAAISSAEDGLIFARTLRGDAEIKTPEGALKSGETAAAKGAEISAKNGFASFALSNFSSCLLFSGNIKIEKFEQEKIPDAPSPDFSEKSASEILISVGEEAEAVFARGEARPASKFKIETRFGVFELKPESGNIKIKISKNEARVSAYNAGIFYSNPGPVSIVAYSKSTNEPLIWYSNPGSQKPEYMQIGCELVFSGERSGEIKELGAKDTAAAQKAVSSARYAFKSTEFYKDAGGKIRARRIALKEFFIRMPKTNK